MEQRMRWMAAIVVIFALLQMVACAPAPAQPVKVAPAKLEPIEGSEFKRVLLTEKAMERLQIETAAVRTGPATRTRRVGGEVVAAPAAPSPLASSGATTAMDAPAADLGRILVRVSLSESELKMVDRSQRARVRPLQTDDDEDGDDLDAELDDADEIDDAEDAPRAAGDASLLYAVNDANAALSPGQPVFVRLPLMGSGAERKIVPFGALLYGVHGETWVYTNPEPLVFVRVPVTVDFIEDDLAYLSEGPAAGTLVVTVGGSLLYGTETGVSK